MKTTVMKWGAGGIAALLGAMACSGTSLNNVGELNGGGSGGSPGAGGTLGAGNGTGNSAGSGQVSPGGGGSGAGGSGTISPGGGGGFAGNHPVVDPPGDAGAGGEPDSEGLHCPKCTLVASDEDVRGVAANDAKVFWVDYGTSDALGNYDGRLMARDLAGGATTMIADTLPGPESVSLSSQYVYMLVDQRTEPEHAFGVARVPLAGGAAQPLQSMTQQTSYSGYRIFASAPGYEYWNWNGAVYRVAETPGATVETVLDPRQVSSIAIAGAELYFQDPAGIWSVPLASGTPTKLFDVDSNVLVMQLVTSDDVYAMELASSNFLTRMPKAGGAWTRLANLSNDNWSQLALDNAGHFFIDPPRGSFRFIVQASLAAPEPQTTLAWARVVQGEQFTWKAWTLSSVGVFVADSSGLYLTPTAQ